MRIWVKSEIVDNPEFKDSSTFVTDQDCREALQEALLEILERDKEVDRLKARLATTKALLKGMGK